MQSHMAILRKNQAQDWCSSLCGNDTWETSGSVKGKDLVENRTEPRAVGG